MQLVLRTYAVTRTHSHTHAHTHVHLVSYTHLFTGPAVLQPAQSQVEQPSRREE